MSVRIAGFNDFLIQYDHSEIFRWFRFILREVLVGQGLGVPNPQLGILKGGVLGVNIRGGGGSGCP